MKLFVILIAFCTTSPEDQVQKFYDWYINSISDKSIYSLLRPAEKEGQTHLLTKPYLDSLGELEVFHPDFFESERVKYDKCTEFLSKWSWKDYHLEEPDYSGYCDFLDYHQWFWQQEPISQIEIVKQEVSGTKALLTLNGYFDDGANRILMVSNIKVSLNFTQANG